MSRLSTYLARIRRRNGGHGRRALRFDQSTKETVKGQLKNPDPRGANGSAVVHRRPAERKRVGPSLDCLPEDVVIRIFLVLDALDVLSVAQVCPEAVKLFWRLLQR